jgi:hypothetical protein
MKETVEEDIFKVAGCCYGEREPQRGGGGIQDLKEKIWNIFLYNKLECSDIYLEGKQRNQV